MIQTAAGDSFFRRSFMERRINMAFVGKSGLSLFLSNLKTFLNNNFAAKSHTHSAATTSANGLMSKADKVKLDGIATGANKYTHPAHTAKNSGLYKVTVDAQGHVSAATAVAKSDITALGIPSTNTTYANMKGATTSTAGTAGLVPAPATGAANRYLRSDGTWQVPPNTTYSVVSTSANGLMSSADKTKLDGIATGANKYTHPTTSGNKHIPSGGSSGQILRWSADGTAVWGADNNTTYSLATQSADGLMSAADKAKLDKIAYMLGIDDTGVYVEDL